MSDKDKAEVERLRNILKLVVGMIELLTAEDEEGLDQAQKKLTDALLELEDEGLQ